MPTFTLADISARVLDRLDNNSLLYPASQVTTAINEAIQCVNLMSPFCQTTIDIGFSVAAQQIYGTPTGMIFPLHIFFNGKQLQKVSLRSISMRFRNWTTDIASQGTPVQRWIPLGLGMFAIHPQDNSGGQTISVTGVIEPVPLVNPTDSLTIEDEWITIIEDYAFFTLTIKESAAEFSGTSMTYQKFIRDMKGKIRYDGMRFGKYWLIQSPQQAEGGAV